MKWVELYALDAKTRYSCAREVIALSKSEPELILQDLQSISPLLEVKSNVLVWTAIQVIGNLSAHLSESEVWELIPKLVGLMHCQTMITSANAIRALGQIAKNRPVHAEAIVSTLLEVESMNYVLRGEPSPECRNVALGHVLAALKSLPASILCRPLVLDFIRRQTSNSRSAVAAKALSLERRLKRRDMSRGR